MKFDQSIWFVNGWWILNKLWFTYIVNFGFSFPTLHTDISVDCIFPFFFVYLMTIFSICIFYLLKNVHNTKNTTLICKLKLNIRINNNWECNVFLLFSCAHSTLYYIFFSSFLFALANFLWWLLQAPRRFKHNHICFGLL